MTLRILLEAALFGAGLLPAAFGLWWTLLAVLALPSPRPGPALARGPRGRVVVVIPAHNEEHTLPSCLASIAASTMLPTEVLVVADNCSDATAQVARDAGATVLVRNDALRRGKSYALDHALLHLRTQRPAYMVVFVDADTALAPDCLAALKARLDAGTAVVQAYYQGAPTDSRVGRLRRLGLSLVHWARPLGASRLGLSTTLKGNGMAFHWAVIEAGSGGHGVTEDAAMTLNLVARGIPVVFEPRARVTGLMAQDYASARIQDERWEGGRAQLLGVALAAAWRALRRGQLRCAAAALEVASPPLSAVSLLALIALVAAWATGSASVAVASLAVVTLVGYVCIGLVAARASRHDLAAMADLPRFVWHKFTTYVALMHRGAPTTWERTRRGR